MTNQEALQECYDRAMNDVFSYAANYLMSEPKKGYETEFAHSKALAEALEDIMANCG